ncbi:MAG TPA: phage holin family protein [Acidimicrobiales bacterium]|nr:phage holin family protein [Acidimicrobiales bacterium]
MMTQPMNDRPRRRVQPAADSERSVGELLSGVSSNLQNLLRSEMELARIETKDQIAKAGKAGAMFGGTAVAAFVGLLLVSMAAAWGLAEVMPPGLAFLIVGVVFAVAAGLLFMQAKRKLAGFSPVPTQTVQTLKQDVTVAKESFKAGASGPPDQYRYWKTEGAR